MVFRLVHARYDRESGRAYVELREPDDEGGEILVSTIFSYRTASNLSKQEATQDIIRKARHALKRAAGGT
jgi:hypothetical protein